MRRWPLSLLPVALVIAAAPLVPSPDHPSGRPGGGVPAPTTGTTPTPAQGEAQAASPATP